MKPNHIFIFCDNHDEVANELIEFGFIEGSSRIHPNQGTKNRKFYFNDFYIEILWVHDINEATSKLTNPTQLYERSKYKINGASQFGLCVNYSTSDDELFQNRLEYKPTYLPKDTIIEVLSNKDSITLPWTFRWKVDLSNYVITEPINLPKQKLLKVAFGIKRNEVQNNYLQLFKSDIIFFENAKQEFLKLIFSDTSNREVKTFKSVSLIIEF